MRELYYTGGQVIISGEGLVYFFVHHFCCNLFGSKYSASYMCVMNDFWCCLEQIHLYFWARGTIIHEYSIQVMSDNRGTRDDSAKLEIHFSCSNG